VHFSGGLPEGYTPVTLAPKGTNLSAGTEEEMLGYGISNAGRQSGAGQLRQTSSTVLERVDRDQYMSDGRKSSVCFGDSGGPAFVQTGGRWAQWGVAHSVLNQACNEASVHTSVMPFLRWIQASQAKLAGSKN
jgi:secreted trypsin-like serine protease